MGQSQKVFEFQLYDIWKNRQYSNELKTVNGDQVVILDTGNLEQDIDGPDFKNARVRIGNLTFVGDIEIDNDYRDWMHHGHNIDRKYNKVILHASLTNKFNQPYVYTKEGRKVPSICLNRFIDDSLLKNVVVDTDDKTKHLRCTVCNKNISLYVKEKFLTDLGIERFKKKCKKIHMRLKELLYLKELKISEPVIQYDLLPSFDDKKFPIQSFQDQYIWQQVFYELIFEALGYSNNKTIMTNLAQSVPLSFIKKLDIDNEYQDLIESTLFGVAGLLPKENEIVDEKISAYVSQLLKNWSLIKRIYDGPTYSPTDWHFFKLRPQNFPTIRIAAGSRIINEITKNNLIGKLADKIAEIKNFTMLINYLRSLFIIKSEGYWAFHYVFDKPCNGDVKFFVGTPRADEIVVNVILPFFALYFEVFQNEKLTQKVYKLYTLYRQKSDNKIVRSVASDLGVTELAKRTVYAQGMIELFRNFCSKSQCLECQIGEQVFS